MCGTYNIHIRFIIYLAMSVFDTCGASVDQWPGGASATDCHASTAVSLRSDIGSSTCVDVVGEAALSESTFSLGIPALHALRRHLVEDDMMDVEDDKMQSLESELLLCHGGGDVAAKRRAALRNGCYSGEVHANFWLSLLIASSPDEAQRRHLATILIAPGPNFSHRAGGNRELKQLQGRLKKELLVPEVLLRGVPELQVDREFVLGAAFLHGHVIEHVSSVFRADREVIMAAVSKNGHALQHASIELRADREVVVAAVTNIGHALEHAAEEWRGDCDVVWQAICRSPMALAHVSSELQDNQNLVMMAVSKNGAALQFASSRLRAMSDVAQIAVRRSVTAQSRASEVAVALQHSDVSLRGNKSLVLAAVERDGLSLRFACPELQKDPEVVQAAVSARIGSAMRQADGTKRRTSRKGGNGTSSTAHEVAQLSSFDSIQEVQDGGELSDQCGPQALADSAAGWSQWEDRDVVLLRVASHGEALEFASPALQSDREVVHCAVAHTGDALRFAAPELLLDYDFVIGAVSQSRNRKLRAEMLEQGVAM
jgi:hypothetical protein